MLGYRHVCHRWPKPQPQLLLLRTASALPIVSAALPAPEPVRTLQPGMITTPQTTDEHDDFWIRLGPALKARNVTVRAQL